MNLSTLFLIIGIALAGIGIIMFLMQRARLAKCIHAEGVVIELVRSRMENEYVRKRTSDGVKTEAKYQYRPVICFRTHSGRTIKFMANLYVRPAPYEIGDCVDILYNPDKPEQAQINSFVQLWFYVIMLLSFGLFMMGMGYLGIVLT